MDKILTDEEFKKDFSYLKYCVRSFHNQINKIRQYLIEQLSEMQKNENIALNEYNENLKKLKESIELIQDEKEKQETSLVFLKMIVEDSPNVFSDVIVQSLFLNIFSLLDTFIGRFLETMFTIKPCLLNTENKTVSLDSVLESSSIEDFKTRYVKDYIDKFKRDSYVAQIKSMQNIFHIATLTNFENWSNFVEITQRRNIIKHCDGIISNEYIKICNENGCLLKSVKAGTKLNVSLEYLKTAINVVEEVVVKLLHTVWRKQLSDKIEESDESLINYTFELLIDENWDLAICLSEFGKNQKNISSDVEKIILTINYCIGLYHSDLKDLLKKTLEEMDFSAVSYEFKLAKAVLLEEYEEAYNYMKKIGTEGDYFKRDSYLDFPLFKVIREEKKFKEVYSSIFPNIDYVEIEKEIEKRKDERQDI